MTDIPMAFSKVAVTAHGKSAIEYTVAALTPYKRKTTRHGREYETMEQIWWTGSCVFSRRDFKIDVFYRNPLSSTWLNYLKPRLTDYGSALFIVRNRTLTDDTTGEDVVLVMAISD